jgi:hypothetical protein
MKNYILKRFAVSAIAFLSFTIFSVAQVTELQSQLEKLPEVISVKKIDNHPFFNETYEIMVEQLLDHKNPSAGKFAQRVFLSDYNKYSPVVFVTEGYKADYAERSSYINELSEILQANQLVVEHRYFGKSQPDIKNWDYLTIENACADLNRVQRIFKRIYNFNNKWIATGISKGGQNTIAYKAFYPDAADAWIPYVAPVTFAVEDKRMEQFIPQIGTPECREKIKDFQLTILKNRDIIQPMLDSFIVAAQFSFAIPNSAVLDYCVLEYSFAFWQWENNCAEIPSDTVSPYALFKHLVKVSGPDYFALEKVEPIKAFFIQAVKEFGYYGYDTKPFSPYLTIQSAKGYLPEVFLKGEPSFKFNKKTSKFIEKAIQKGGENMILIYGENDPWTAGGIVPKKSSKAVRFVQPNAAHRARINSMSYAQRAELYMLLESILEKY